MRNKILLGTGIGVMITGIVGIFAADKAKKNSKLITFISVIVALVGVALTAKVLDEELYPEEFSEEEESLEEKPEEDEPTEDAPVEA